VRKIYQEAGKIKNDELRQQVVKHARASENHYRIKAMIDLATSEPGAPVEIHDLDRNPMLLTCRNGTLDLATGELRKPDPKDLITKMIPVEYDPRAKASLWEAFLDKVLAGHAELMDYMQRAVGYCLTGDVTAQCLFFLYGLGANGKSTFLNALKALLGEYHRQVPLDTFLLQKHSSIPNDLTMLKGARVASVAEVESGKRLAEVLVKQVTGGDTITARFMRQEFFEYAPEFKIFFAANHKPLIYGTDYAIWRRIRLIPFTVTIPEGEQDPRFVDKLKVELPGILAWAVRGCRAWQREGLRSPGIVNQATEDYRSEMDVLGSFIEDRCEVGPKKEVKKRDLYADYETWCADEKEKPLSKKAFGLRIKERGIIDKRTGKDRFWVGVELKGCDT
jgi:putative DNA primase/helicase